MLIALLSVLSAVAFPFSWQIEEFYRDEVGCLKNCWAESKWYELGGTYDIHETTKDVGHITGRTCSRAETVAINGGIALYQGDTSIDSWFVQGGCKKCWTTYTTDFRGQLANRVRVCGGNGDCHQPAYPFTMAYHRVVQIGQVDAASGKVLLGSVGGLYGSTLSRLLGSPGWGIRVSTDNSQVLLWVGDAQSPKTQRFTASASAEIWACADTDKNGACDYDQDAARACLSDGGDWYKGACCDDAKGCVFDTTRNALCGKTEDDSWKWAPRDVPGQVHAFVGCPNASVVSDGTQFFGCGQQFGTVTVPFGDFRSINVSGVRHEFYCKDGSITECGGNPGAFSPNDAQSIGATLLLNQTRVHYCASDGDWTTDLDVKDRDSCEAAGLGWTGALCCGEADDGRESYNDPLAATAKGRGGCWNNTYVETGQFSVPGRVINYLGQFFGCRLNGTLSPLLQLRDTRNPAVPLINNSIATCGAVLPDAVPGGSFPHAVCNPSGVWEFTDQLVGTIQKGIKWSLFVNTSTIKQFGCCAFDQCWNGTRCQPLGAFYRIGDRGFTCDLPRVMIGDAVSCFINPQGQQVCN
jgi:hypothetical protein